MCEGMCVCVSSIRPAVMEEGQKVTWTHHLYLQLSKNKMATFSWT